MAKEAQKLANHLMAQIKKSYEKVTVGKAIWKQIMVTALLFGKAVVVAAKSTINKVQSIKNRVKLNFMTDLAGKIFPGMRLSSLSGLCEVVDSIA